MSVSLLLLVVKVSCISSIRTKTDADDMGVVTFCAGLTVEQQKRSHDELRQMQARRAAASS